MTPYRADIEAAAKRHLLDPDLVEALVVVESSGQADAFRFEPAFYERYLEGKPEYRGAIPRRISSSYGLCQVMYPVARELGFKGQPEELFVPATSLEYGCRKLRALIDWSLGNVDAALAAYNGGKVGNRRAPYRNQRYVTKVIAARERVRAARREGVSG
jgi:soluble lytic murein transglycosylase-like protein